MTSDTADRNDEMGVRPEDLRCRKGRRAGQSSRQYNKVVTVLSSALVSVRGTMHRIMKVYSSMRRRRCMRQERRHS